MFGIPWMSPRRGFLGFPKMIEVAVAPTVDDRSWIDGDDIRPAMTQRRGDDADRGDWRACD